MFAKSILVIFVGIFLSAPAFGKQYWPTIEWKTSSPQSQDFDSRSISEMFEFIRKKEFFYYISNYFKYVSLFMIENCYLDIY